MRRNVDGPSSPATFKPGERRKMDRVTEVSDLPIVLYIGQIIMPAAEAENPVHDLPKRNCTD